MALAANALLVGLEAISRERPDRVLRLRGALDSAGALEEPYELLIFRGFSSSTTHPTGSDPDQPLLPEGVRLLTAELLAGPLDPAAEQVLAAGSNPQAYLQAPAWL
ncbi:hypothetical protein KQ300_08160 [Synechococcus sp. CS-1331]|uniref:DUF7734 family protein n=1 Tax=Synechococcus sp. CS-1331 TaxID=2847973 RepID=UPI0019CC3677|nr:hypothetical protein [Synechococcus sp. CS-1331]MCT0228159.1 hypothetical protein [Synechococcus sp. CS-1331]NQW38442.1 hypothetical protein [Cyanobacteria bacterium bin.275]